MEMKMVSLLDHEVTLVSRDGDIIETFPKGKKVARIIKKEIKHKSIPYKGYEIENSSVMITRISNLPKEREGVLLIVSRLILDLFPKRTDLISPKTFNNDCLRNGERKVVGVFGWLVSAGENKF